MSAQPSPPPPPPPSLPLETPANPPQPEKLIPTAPPPPARDTASYNTSTDLPASPTFLKAGSLTKTVSNTSANGTYLRQPQSVTRQQRSSSADTLSLFSVDDFHELRQTDGDGAVVEHISTTSAAGGRSQDDPGAASDGKSQSSSRLKAAWVRNKGLALVAVAQMFGTLMNITTRLLEVEGNGGKGMHPFQILFARMSITFLLCMLYMWHQKIPDFPFGAREVRWLLVARGMGGFFGVFGLYWSLQYLPLSDATVLTFLAPSLASYLCSKLIAEPFTRVEQIGGFVSLFGVVLIARPTYFFSSSTAPTETSDATAGAGSSLHEATPSQRLAAVGMAMIGVLGATCAYTTIRWIGKRAHPLVSVNYFAAWCTLVSTIALTCVPSIPFVLPSTPKEWMLLFFIGVSGFVMQFLLTAGLRYEKSSRATNMVYTQLLFALAGDELVFGVAPGGWSLAGSALILGSAVVVAVQKEAAAGTGRREGGGGGSGGGVDMGSTMSPGAATATATSTTQTSPPSQHDPRHRVPDEERGLVVSDSESDNEDEDEKDKGRDEALSMGGTVDVNTNERGRHNHHNHHLAVSLEMQELRHLDSYPPPAAATIITTPSSLTARENAQVDLLDDTAIPTISSAPK